MTTLEPDRFLRTVYVGDRACKALRIESWNNEVVIEVTCISRVRSTSGDWEYYSEWDIPNGRIVFTGVESISFQPAGPLPNDFINYIVAKPASNSRARSLWTFEASISSVADDATTTEVIVVILAEDVHLEDPNRAGVKIRE